MRSLFFSWGLSVGLFGNHREADPDAIKRQLVRATIAGCDAIWLADPRARFLHCDPLIHLVPDEESEACYQRTAELNDAQFHAWDMLAGAREPELGGRGALSRHYWRQLLSRQSVGD
ncbi:hypothetical protein OJE16_00715 [Pantoea tagorei]